MKKTYQTYHAEHGSEHGESRVGDVGFISHGQEDHTAIKLPLKPTYLREKNSFGKYFYIQWFKIIWSEWTCSVVVRIINYLN